MLGAEPNHRGIGNALWKKRRLKLVTLNQAVAALEGLPSRLRLFDIANLAARAVQIAVELNHPIYDCFYLALAERERCALVTADVRLLAAAKRVKKVELRPL